LRPDGEWPDQRQRWELDRADWRRLSVTFGSEYARRVYDTATAFDAGSWETTLDVGDYGGDVLLSRRDTIAIAVVPYRLDHSEVLARITDFQTGFRPAWTYVILPPSEDPNDWPTLDKPDGVITSRVQWRFPEYMRLVDHLLVAHIVPRKGPQPCR
jgi:hypothetical protein